MNGELNMYHEQISEFVLGNLIRSPAPESRYADDKHLVYGAIDSLGIVKLVAFLEQRFGVRIADDEVLPENFESVNAISDFVTSKTG